MKSPGSRPSRLLLVALCLVLAAGCGQGPSAEDSDSQPLLTRPPETESALERELENLEPARPRDSSKREKELASAIDRYFEASRSHRLYLHVDRPMYQPGEAVWFRVWELETATLARPGSEHGITVELADPKGAVLFSKRIRVVAGVAANDFELPAEAQGGEYVVRMTSDLGATAERKILVSQYQPPLLKKKLEFLRKAYGAGDRVAAALALHRATGEPLGQKTVTAVAHVDQVEVARHAVTTDTRGRAMVSFELPKQIALGEGLLTVLVEDGGITESIQKRIPILLKELNVRFYPEGGDLVAGLPNRVYFQARTLAGKPADVDGRIVDDDEREVARFKSFHNGMGRFRIQPNPSRNYFAEIEKPAGIAQKIALPEARTEGCTLQAVEDAKGGSDQVRVGVWCTESREVIATAVLHERRLGTVPVRVEAGKPALIAMPISGSGQGAVRFTLFDDELHPLAERLLYRGRGRDLKVAIKPDRATYSPRDPVSLQIEASDATGRPVEADLSVAVVDDVVLSLADDKTAHLPARIYLESEMPGQEIEEPNFYFSDDPKAGEALDLVLGTQGWRRFEWQQVLQPQEPVTVGVVTELFSTLFAPPYRARRMERPLPEPLRLAPKKYFADVREGKIAFKEEEAQVLRQRAFAGNGDVAGMPMPMEAFFFDQLVPVWAPVRVFPAPNYSGRHDGPRTDFRETLHWEPSVKTDRSGRANLHFYLSDAVTSFRVTAEGVSAQGLPGRAETLLQSKLPVSLAVTMPLELATGDLVRLPVSVSNETDRSYTANLTSGFGSAFELRGDILESIALAPHSRKTFFAELAVVGGGREPADGLVQFGVRAAGLADEISRTIRVVPLGFPREQSFSGVVEKTVRHEVDLSGALPDSIEAEIALYPSPLATLLRGVDAVLRDPYGCFEQASSANYPNVMVLDYLQKHDAAEPELVERTMALLDAGYKRLNGYESPSKGYEWFGGDPGHEALTAYGLMEFFDMARVYDGVDRGMVERTKVWLRSRRDGKGGYLRNARALDSFGAASEEVTNGYITYALSETGEKDLARELALQKEIARTTKDPYLMALAANTLYNLEPTAPATTAAVRKLAAMQQESGGFTGADHSITRSGGEALDVETTALAVAALVRARGAADPAVRKAIDWLNQQRTGNGNFSSTQATILALRALTSYADAARVTTASGTATLTLNGTEAGRIRFEKGQKGALVFENVKASLRPGRNVIELALGSESSLPYSLAIRFRSPKPASSPEAKLALETSLARGRVAMGETVRMRVKLENLTAEGLPMALARVGLPGGLTFQIWQLRELKDKGVIDFYETREREVILYFRSMVPKAVRQLDLDLTARVPGEYLAPASQAYLYYTDEHRHWVEPTRVTVTPGAEVSR